MIPTEIANFFIAMQAGQTARAEMEACFAPTAIYEEPFSGEMRRHEGRAAVMAAMDAGWANPLPEMRLVIDKVSTDGGQVQVDWTCLSPALPGGQGQGHNHFDVEAGQITRLVTTMKGPQ